ncbi:hypothetical protein ACSFA3_17285 [Variovorax sp. RHLX14]|uniref:hypothetical protein n=1 Tax=Variovorax sp. RHLX14 TaxID=1259731 RepID=UPI003F487838
MQTKFNLAATSVKDNPVLFSSTVGPSISPSGIWTRKTLDTAKTPADQSFPKPLGAMLTGTNLEKLEKNEAAHLSYLRAQLKNHKLDHLNVGNEIGRGAAKTAYDLPGTGTALVTIPSGPWGLADEIKNINRLKTAGMPTAKILAVGNYRGSEAMVMEKFSEIVKPMPPTTASGEDFVNSRLTNHRTLASLIKIRDSIAREKIIVLDLQFGVRGPGEADSRSAKDQIGSLAVLDPFQVWPSEDGFDNASQLQDLDELISAIREKLSSRRFAVRQPIGHH